MFYPYNPNLRPTDEGKLYAYQYLEEMKLLPDHVKIGFSNNTTRRMKEWSRDDGMTPFIFF